MQNKLKERMLIKITSYPYQKARILSFGLKLDTGWDWVNKSQFFFLKLVLVETVFERSIQ